jgi:hypothetical protein
MYMPDAATLACKMLRRRDFLPTDPAARPLPGLGTPALLPGRSVASEMLSRAFSAAARDGAGSIK